MPTGQTIRVSAKSLYHGLAFCVPACEFARREVLIVRNKYYSRSDESRPCHEFVYWGGWSEVLWRSKFQVRFRMNSLDLSFSDPLHRTDQSLGDLLRRHLFGTLAKDSYSATTRDYYASLVYAVREYVTGRWLRSQQRTYREDRKRVYYLSMEYLMGRLLSNALSNLGLLEQTRKELADFGLDLDRLIAAESEAGLGNGGLGRLAACLLDSLATLGLPAYGYGIRFEYGIFNQKIEQGSQVESPDYWLRFGNPWEIARPEDVYPVRYGGFVRELCDAAGRQQHEWVAAEDVMAMAYDIPIPGYRNDTVNTLRVWAADSSRGFNFESFNRGDYVAAVEQTSRSRSISRVLYPNDNIFVGKVLRLKQEYFFVSASLQDIVRRFKKTHDRFEDFPDKVAIQLNDTHPALAIPELMRVLVDLEQLSWDEAWEIVVATFGYTNHTLLPEALEEWPVSLLQQLLPRHLQIIYEINHRFLQAVRRRYPGDLSRLQRMSMISEDREPRVRMAHLAVVGSHAVNGVSQLHAGLLRQRLFVDFDEFYPWRFLGITNGITPRRWLKVANPLLSDLISNCIGEGWVRDLAELRQLTSSQDDPGFADRWEAVKRQNKQRLAEHIRAEHGLHLDIDSIFDCQVKRIHEYKRQLLNVLHVISLYNRIRRGNAADVVPRTIIISGKAAPGYLVAKLIIKLIHDVAEVINHDPRTRDLLKLVFLPNYNVSLAELILPAVDLSEQISTAGTEASGTGNMKAMLNGAVTIGTLDGANIEIAEAVAEQNIFLFGSTAADVEAAPRNGYDPQRVYLETPELREAIEMVRMGFFSAGDESVYQPLWDSVFGQHDRYMVLMDFADYAETQQRAADAYRNRPRWLRMSILNVAHAGPFSCDRMAMTYAREIWNLDLPSESSRCGNSGRANAAR